MSCYQVQVTLVLFFALFVPLQSSVPSVHLTATSCHHYTCVASNVSSLSWWLDAQLIAHYTYSTNDTFPLTLSSGWVQVNIEAVKKSIWGNYHMIHSSLSLGVDNTSLYTSLKTKHVYSIKCGSKDAADAVSSDTACAPSPTVSPQHSGPASAALVVSQHTTHIHSTEVLSTHVHSTEVPSTEVPSRYTILLTSLILVFIYFDVAIVLAFLIILCCWRRMRRWTCICIICTRICKRRRYTVLPRMSCENGRFSHTVPNQSRQDYEELCMRSDERIEQERTEREKAREHFRTFIYEENLYKQNYIIPDIGSRLQKYYCSSYSVETSSHVVITIAPVPKNCTLDLSSDLEIINRKLLPPLCQMTIFHPIYHIHLAGEGSSQVIVVQHLATQGSLRDMLYGEMFDGDWSEKYLGKRGVLSHEKIAKYGGQILSAVLYLYEQGFPPLGHIHAGNIFMTDDGCALGGYDNTLLGYRSSIHRLFGKDLSTEFLESIDVIMFGRVIFEMASQADLCQLTPDDDDLETVADLAVREVLRDIFELDKEGKLKTLKMVSSLSFFSTNDSSLSAHVRSGLRLGVDVRSLLTPSRPGSRQDSGEKTQKKISGIVKRMKGMDDIETCVLRNIGLRDDKYWRSTSDRKLMSFAKVAENIPIVLLHHTVITLNRLLSSCAECQLIQPCKVHFDSKSCYVVVTQPLWECSLRDHIFKTEALMDMSDKLRFRGQALTAEKIALYSSQILKAVLALYKAGFPPLGHIHTGNIFVDGDRCLLGGHENILLGYQPAQFCCPEKYGEFIDILMFGHVVFEMASGRALQTVTPSTSDYEEIFDRSVKRFLAYIFEIKQHKFVNSISKIYQNQFVRGKVSAIPDIQLDPAMERMLKKVSKRKSRKHTKFGRLVGFMKNKVNQH